MAMRKNREKQSGTKIGEMNKQEATERLYS
jgi:hypothetical protein